MDERDMSEIFQGRYIAITPCRNEEINLTNLIHSMNAQTLKPVLWVIVDDGSTDKTGRVIAHAEKKYDWIKGLYLKENKEYMGTHLAFVCNKGFEFAKDYCIKNNIEYKYIALIDADNIPEIDYFRKLIDKFENNPKLGIVSGNSAYVDIEKIENILKNKNEDLFDKYKKYLIKIQSGREDLPMGSARIWRKECFEATGGYAIVQAPDNVSNIKAKLRGWETRRFRDIKVIERKGESKQGLWKGYNWVGESNYYRGYPFYVVVLKALKYSFDRPYFLGIAYLWGYIKSLIYRKKRISDKEIIKYYQSVRPRELKDYYKVKFKKWLNHMRPFSN